MFKTINGARLAAKRVMAACGVANAPAREIVARAAGYRDWHHLNRMAGKEERPAGGDVEALGRHLALTGVDTNVHLVMKAVLPGVVASHEDERLRRSIGPDAWGGAAVVEKGRPTDFIAVDQPANETLDEMLEHIDTEELEEEEAIAIAAREVDVRIGGREENRLLEHAMATHGRAMAVMADQDGTYTGVSFEEPLPGESVADALLRLVARTASDAAPDWDIAPIDVDGELFPVGGYWEDELRRPGRA